MELNYIEQAPQEPIREEQIPQEAEEIQSPAIKDISLKQWIVAGVLTGIILSIIPLVFYFIFYGLFDQYLKYIFVMSLINSLSIGIIMGIFLFLLSKKVIFEKNLLNFSLFVFISVLMTLLIVVFSLLFTYYLYSFIGVDSLIAISGIFFLIPFYSIAVLHYLGFTFGFLPLIIEGFAFGFLTNYFISRKL